MAIDFLGHKRQLLDFVVEGIHSKIEPGDRVVADLFAGTASVSAAFKERGYRVYANDTLAWCVRFAEAVLLNDDEPQFQGIIGSIPRARPQLLDPSPYDIVLAHLNSLPPREGFITRNYSPSAEEAGGPRRMYFTSDNAARIDAVRGQIEEWSSALTRAERALLIVDLVKAANSVSNTAGTYGCFLKYWKPRALRRVELRPSRIIRGTGGHEVFQGDANVMAPHISAPTVYADPPYTKRQYAAYYHILETIALADNPSITGSTGLRRWQEEASAYCYIAKAPSALRDLVSKVDCRHFFLSYSEDGRIPHTEILRILQERGRVEFTETSYRRYKSSSKPHKGRDVRERLYHLVIGRAT